MDDKFSSFVRFVDQTYAGGFFFFLANSFLNATS